MMEMIQRWAHVRSCETTASRISSMHSHWAGLGGQGRLSLYPGVPCVFQAVWWKECPRQKDGGGTRSPQPSSTAEPDPWRLQAWAQAPSSSSGWWKELQVSEPGAGPALCVPTSGVAEESCPCLRDKVTLQARVIRRGGKVPGAPWQLLKAPRRPQEVEGMLRKGPRN